jgi:hypothetical protein
MKDLITYQNAKTTKGESLGWLTGILYLSPHNLSGRNLCPHASERCAADCLFWAGRGAFKRTQAARLQKTLLFHKDPKEFVESLNTGIEAAKRKAKRAGLNLAIRLNGTSDLPWEALSGYRKTNLMSRHGDITFYDYTKNPDRMSRYLQGEFPENYRLTFSRSESNQDATQKTIERGGNVAVVFGGGLPEKYLGADVVDGDLHDLRFLDPRGVIVGLRAKGRAKKDREDGFVVWKS